MSQRSLIAIFCAGVLYLTLFYQLGNLAFVGADEPRYARVGEEMNLKDEYITPTLDFRPWLEKPPLLFWIESASFRIFGVSERTARLPVAVLSLLCLLSLGSFLHRFAGMRTGILGVLILSTSGLFFVYARAASTDAPMVATFTMGLLGAFWATRAGTLLPALAAGVCLGLAVLAKGPVALILFLGVFGLYFLFLQSIRWSRSQVLAMAAAFLLTSVPWFFLVWRTNGYAFVSTFWINHHLARFLTDIHHHTQPFWYYLPVLLLGFFPWVCFLPSSFRRVWEKRRSLDEDSVGLELFLWLAVIVPFVFFSAGRSKLPGYVLPAVPPMAALAALQWNRWMDPEAGLPPALRNGFLAMGLVGLALSGALLWGFTSVYETPSLGVLLAFPLAAGTLWGCRQGLRGRPAAAFFSVAAAMTLFAALLYWKGAPVVDDFHSARDLSRHILPRINPRAPLILYRYFHHTAHYYTGYQATRESVESPAELIDYLRVNPQERYYLLTQEAGWRELESFQPRLIEHRGNLFLVELSGRVEDDTRTVSRETADN